MPEHCKEQNLHTKDKMFNLLNNVVTNPKASLLQEKRPRRQTWTTALEPRRIHGTLMASTSQQHPPAYHQKENNKKKDQKKKKSQFSQASSPPTQTRCCPSAETWRVSLRERLCFFGAG